MRDRIGKASRVEELVLTKEEKENVNLRVGSPLKPSESIQP
jgi:hypothetical protein